MTFHFTDPAVDTFGEPRSRVLYNEWDSYAARLLRTMAGHPDGPVRSGDVDERSIREIRAEDVVDRAQVHFFAGIGIWSLALEAIGWPTDLVTWTGSCPCQPFSQAGSGTGLADDRHLWPEFFRLIDQCQPDVVFGEQVSSAYGLAWFDIVRSDLERAGYALGVLDTCAAGVGSPNLRQWLYWFAVRLGNAAGIKQKLLASRLRAPVQPSESPRGRGAPDRQPGHVNGFWADAEWLDCADGIQRPSEPGTLPVANGTSADTWLLRAFGNGLNAQVAIHFAASARKAIADMDI